MPIIGRKPPADIVVNNQHVSRSHAKIFSLGNGEYELSDMGSTNGTFVNGTRIQTARVRPTDRITLGEYDFDINSWLHVIEDPSLTARLPNQAFQGQNAGYRPPSENNWTSNQQNQGWQQPQQQQPWQQQQQQQQQHYNPPPPKKEKPPSYNNKPGLGTEVAVAMASQKSFVGAAFLTWFLYYLGWFPGVIMNLVYHHEAAGIRKITGRSPSGMGCLTFLLITHLILPIILIVIIVISGGALLTEILNEIDNFRF